MIEAKVKQCPKCQSNKIVVTRLKQVAYVVGQLNQESALFAEICVDCGEVVRMAAEKPERLKGEEEND